MKFNYIETDYEGGNHWKSEDLHYKIKHYEYYTEGNFLLEKPHYQAYIPDHWHKGKPIFGNFVDRNVKYYLTFEDAVKACEKHKLQEV